MYHRKQSQFIVKEIGYPVENIVRAGVDHLDHNVGVEEVGGDHVRYEGSVFFLEYDGHNVVPYVPLSLQLQHTSHVETHDKLI